ncbi:MAG: hypothetical protein IPK12_22375 [Gemmatimonadetes bacterium]|nr:hypothetical protein [Gemmatimonadota bacterium]
MNTRLPRTMTEAEKGHGGPAGLSRRLDSTIAAVPVVTPWSGRTPWRGTSPDMSLQLRTTGARLDTLILPA